MLPKKFWIWALLSVLALSGSASIIWLSSLNGIGMANDSRSYLAMTQYFLNGSAQNLFLIKFLITHYPPGFPFVLALCSRLSGLAPAEACRWLQAGLLGCNILLVGLLLAKYTRSVLMAIAGACVVLMSAPILLIHLSVMSEPMFIFFMLLWLVFFMDFLENSRRSSFILCVMALMAVCLTRRIGVAFVLTSLAGIFLFKKECVKTRCVYAVVLMSASLLPLWVWMLRNILFIGKAIAGAEINFHPQTLERYNIFNKFPFFSTHTAFFSGREGLILMTVMFFIGMILLHKRDKAALEGIPDGVFILIGVLFYACLSYYFTLIFTMTFIDVFTKSDRLLLPLNVFWILLVGLFMYVILASSPKSGFLKLVFIILCVFVGMANAFETPQRVLQGYYNAGGADILPGGDLKMIAEIKKLPLDKMLYTNSSNALYFLAKRDSMEFIPKYEKTGLDSVYGVFMAKMKDDLQTHKAVLVYFDRSDLNEWFPTLEDIQKEIPLKVVARGLYGAIYDEKDR